VSSEVVENGKVKETVLNTLRAYYALLSDITVSTANGKYVAVTCEDGIIAIENKHSDLYKTYANKVSENKAIFFMAHVDTWDNKDKVFTLEPINVTGSYFRLVDNAKYSTSGYVTEVTALKLIVTDSILS
jgi:hypothetical protein